MEGWIKLYREMINWEWYRDTNTKIVFIHLLLLANHEESKWQGKVIRRGQTITSQAHLAKALNISIQQVRTSLKKLENTGEITVKPTNKFSLITIEKYDNYQSDNFENNTQDNNQSTDNQQADNRQLTTNKNERNNINNNINNFINNSDENFEKNEEYEKQFDYYKNFINKIKGIGGNIDETRK